MDSEAAGPPNRCSRNTLLAGGPVRKELTGLLFLLLLRVDLRSLDPPKHGQFFQIEPRLMTDLGSPSFHRPARNRWYNPSIATI